MDINTIISDTNELSNRELLEKVFNIIHNKDFNPEATLITSIFLRKLLECGFLSDEDLDYNTEYQQMIIQNQNQRNVNC